ncbi:SDR family oxidoreductase [Aquihabitans sp. G128]|uniref:SDR family oxidoreductase n=1 Tax=Aquihabitans sp. G128 TaxID=2849779 RepID=UPI001C22F159|nr:SDR family oxidoreductase [Aquihabitans sp. G128]QXC60682.1 SDR family oxidoreductase [Aquihabitans sp. G128]
MPADPFTGTTAIVTGASRGFGRAIATALTARGATVVGVARDRSALGEVGERLGSSFVGVVADVTEPALASELLAEHRPQLLVLNAGATPRAAAIQDQTWEAFSSNWHTDVRHAFEFTRAALAAPLAPGSTVVAMSSGAARMGSPLSGGYAGAKATVGFISDYAQAESDRQGLGLRFVSLLPKLTGATALGSTFVDAYAGLAGTDRATFEAQVGPALTADQVGAAVIDLASAPAGAARSYLLTADGLAAIA